MKTKILKHGDDWNRHVDAGLGRPTAFLCSKCGQVKPVPEPHPSGFGTTGYGVDRKTGKLVCFECCGEEDAEALRSAKPGERVPVCLYLSEKDGGFEVSNWPGSLKGLRVTHVAEGRHNIARTQQLVWFRMGKAAFHGRVVGENTTCISHLRRLKENA